MSSNFETPHTYQNPLRVKLSDSFFKELPQTPGIYFMIDPQGSILYIGKAKNLKNRLSFYRQAKPGNAPEHILEMIENVFTIRWKKCRSESEALTKESELLHAIRPPFNIAQTNPNFYPFIGVRIEKTRLSHSLSGIMKVEFRFSSYELGSQYAVYGCYKHRKPARRGFAALLRLIHAALIRRGRFSVPAKISRRYPPYLYSIQFPEKWFDELKAFLNGTRIELLHLLMEKLLANETIPAFLYHSIQLDIEIAKKFFHLGPATTHALKERYQVKTPYLSQRQMDELIILSTDCFKDLSPTKV